MDQGLRAILHTLAWLTAAVAHGNHDGRRLMENVRVEAHSVIFSVVGQKKLP